jgi:hypothetical protein
MPFRWLIEIFSPLMPLAFSWPLRRRRHFASLRQSYAID